METSQIPPFTGVDLTQQNVSLVEVSPGVERLRLTPGPNPNTLYSSQFGVVGGTGVDESNHISAIFAYAATAAIPLHVIIRSAVISDPIRIDKTVTLYASNVTVEFQSPVLYGPGGSVRIMGEQTEVLRGATFKAKLSANALEEATTLTLSSVDSSPTGTMQANDFTVGDVIIIRGQNDINGKALTKQTLHISAINSGANTLTVEPLDSSFYAVYPDSDWPADLTTGTTVALLAYAALTVNGVPGESSVTVDASQLASSGIVAGSVVLISTNETEGDVNLHAHSSSSYTDFYKNAARLEIKRVVSANAQGYVTFDSPLIDTYVTTKYAGLTLYNPVVNSAIIGIKGTYRADQTLTSVHAVQIAYGYKCRIDDCQIDGSGGQKSNAIRMSNSLECVVSNCRVAYPKFTTSGAGYGFSVYYSDRCKVLNSTGEGCRHNFLMQKSNNTEIGFCTSINEGISGIDAHGVRSFNTHIFGCRLIGGPLCSDGTSHKSLVRVGNTSHAGGDFGTSILGCHLSGALPGLVQETGTTANGNAVISSINTKRLLVGMPISGTGVPSGTQLIAVGTTSVTMSANASASGTVTLTFIQTYAALEIFGPSSGITMRGCRITDCQTGLRAGYDNLAGASDITVTVGTDVVNLTSHGFVDTTPIIFGTAPAPLVSGTTYYVRDATTHTFKVAATAGGTAIDLTTSPTGIDIKGLVENDPITDVIIDGNDWVNVATLTDTKGVNVSYRKRLTKVDGSTSSVTVTAALPYGSTVPTISEGTEVFSTTYTSKQPGLIKLAFVIPMITTSVSNTTVMATIFVDSVFVGGGVDRIGSTGTTSGAQMIAYGFYNGTGASQTIKVFVGPHAVASTITLPGNLWGGYACPYLLIEE